MKKKIQKSCEYCGKIMILHPSVAERGRRFCSRACFGKGEKSKPKVKVTCFQCGKAFYRWPSRANKDKFFCDSNCQKRYLKGLTGDKNPWWRGFGQISKTCGYCGQTYLVQRDRKERSLYCSRGCHDRSKEGPGNHNWNGGSSFEPYPPTFNNEFKRMIRERDNHTCAVCGKRGKSVHHIDYCKENTIPENVITLCRSCHTKTNSNREYWQEHFSKMPYGN